MSLIEKIHKSRTTVLSMLNDRGIDVSSLNQYTQHEIEIIYNSIKINNKEINGLDILLESPNKVLVKYVFNNKIRISNITSIVEDLIEEYLGENDTLILILNSQSITSQDALENHFNNIYKSKKIFCQYFLLDRITYNITEHSLVPKHEVISNEEANNLLVKYSVTNFSQFPVIYKTDPVAKYYGMKPGNVCKIYRPSETAGQHINYRYCV